MLDYPTPMPPLPPAAAARLADLGAQMKTLSDTFVGYPCSQDFSYPEIIPLLGYAINNVGDLTEHVLEQRRQSL